MIDVRFDSHSEVLEGVQYTSVYIKLISININFTYVIVEGVWRCATVRVVGGLLPP